MRRILVVEDHHDGREFLRQLLIADGHRVEVVATYDGAMRWLSGPDPPPFDVLLTDIGLPDGSGWDLVTLVRNQWPMLRVGVVTGWEPTVLGPGRESADFILRKPFRATELLSLVADSGTFAHTESSDD
jgi:DNA-binding response OmpR family regulator